jgi:hypothetical protein
MLRDRSKAEQRHDAVLALIRDGMRATEVAETCRTDDHRFARGRRWCSGTLVRGCSRHNEAKNRTLPAQG